MAEKKISYTTRDFQGIRTELINFTRTYYPDLVQNFNDAGGFLSNVRFKCCRYGQPTI